MSLGQLSDIGRKPTKLYLIQCNTYIDNKNFNFYFYSSITISNKTELIVYLRQRNRNHSIGVFGDNYVFQSDDFSFPCSIKADGEYNIVYLYYYKNDGNGWRAFTTRTINFEHYEM